MMLTYYPRLNSDGMKRNEYWYKDNIYHNNDRGPTGCEWYAWGRFWEIYGTDAPPALQYDYAWTWYNYEYDNYARGSEPDYGSIICFADGPYSLGFTAIVELINRDDNNNITSIDCSYSFKTYDESRSDIYFGMMSLTPPDFIPAIYIGEGETSFTLQGFIYNPTENGQPLSHGEPAKPWLFKRELWHKEESLLI